MIEEPHASWYSIFQVLKKRLWDISAISTLDWALSNYLLKNNGETFQLAPCDLDKFLKNFTPTATDTATLGFLISSGLIEESKKYFLEGIARCVKQAVPTTGLSIHSDPKLLLGIAASHRLLNDEQKKWLVEQLAILSQNKDLATALAGTYAYRLVDLKAAAKLIEITLRKLEPKTAEECVLALLNIVACRAEFSDSSRAELDRVRTKAMTLLYSIDSKTSESLIAAAAVVVLAELLRNALGTLETTAMGRLIATIVRLPIAAKREKKPLADEYEVQRLLWTMLAGNYDDLQDEQWLKQFGVYQPRADLAIESMKTIIEAKYIRKATDFRKVQDELIVDAKTYTQDLNRFDKIIAVVYDDSSSMHEHEQFRAALKKVEHVVDVVIFSHSNPKPSKRK